MYIPPTTYAQYGSLAVDGVTVDMLTNLLTIAQLKNYGRKLHVKICLNKPLLIPIGKCPCYSKTGSLCSKYCVKSTLERILITQHVIILFLQHIKKKCDKGIAFCWCHGGEKKAKHKFHTYTNYNWSQGWNPFTQPTPLNDAYKYFSLPVLSKKSKTDTKHLL